MRRPAALLVLALVTTATLAGSAAAQAPPSGFTPCGRGFGGGGGGFGGNFTGNGTRRGNFTDNGTGGGFRGSPLPELNMTFDPPTLQLPPGQTGTTTLTMRNDGSDTLNLTLFAGGFGGGRRGGGGAPPMVSASIDPSSGSLDPGASGTATITITISDTTPTNCMQPVNVVAREDATNRTAFARFVVFVPAPAANVTNAGSGATRKAPGPELGLVLAVPLAAALALRSTSRRRSR